MLGSVTPLQVGADAPKVFTWTEVQSVTASSFTAEVEISA